MKKRLNLKMRYSPQGKESSNCAPCSLKMILDYYKQTHPKTYAPFSVQSLNKKLKVSKTWGCQARELSQGLRKLKLKRRKIPLDELETCLEMKRPILTCFRDEEGGGHYAVIKGVEWQGGKKYLIFHDPYWGSNLRREFKAFYQQAKIFNQWHFEISLKN